MRTDAFFAHQEERLDTLRELVPDQAQAHQLVTKMISYDADQRPTARQVVRACRHLRKVVEGPYLSDWSERIVPRVQSTAKPIEDDEFVGTTLMMDPDTRTLVRTDSGVTATPVALPASRRTGTVVTWLAVGTAAVFASLYALTEPERVIVEVPVEVPITAVVGVPEPTLELQPVPEPEAEPEPPSTRSTAATVQVSPPPPVPDPEPEDAAPQIEGYRGLDALERPTNSARFDSIGAGRVFLVDGAGAVAMPGPISPGKYKVKAVIDGIEVAAGRVRVAAGDAVSVKCSEMDLTCEVVGGYPE